MFGWRERHEIADSLRGVADAVESGPESADFRVVDTDKLFLVQYTVHGNNVYAPGATSPVNGNVRTEYAVR